MRITTIKMYDIFLYLTNVIYIFLYKCFSMIYMTHKTNKYYMYKYYYCFY